MKSFTARNPVDLLALVPIVIGFHPTDSIVVLTLESAAARGRPRGQAPQIRTDLPSSEAEQCAVAAHLREVVARHGVSLVAVVLYTDDPAATATVACELVGGFTEDGVEVIDVIRVADGRFFAVGDPTDPGTPFDLGSHAFTAAGVLDGRVVHRDRSAVRDSLVGHDPADAVAVGEAAARFADELLESAAGPAPISVVLAEQADWIRRTTRAQAEQQQTAPQPLPVADAGRLLVLVSFDSLRQTAWQQMSRADATGHVELWRSLTRRSPEDLRAGACGLLGVAAWLAGDGALAWCAVERCLAADPADRLAAEVASLLGAAVPPDIWAPNA